MSQETGKTGEETGSFIWGWFSDSTGDGESESMVSGQPTDMLISKPVCLVEEGRDGSSAELASDGKTDDGSWLTGEL